MAGLWVLPMMRAIAFQRWARDYFGDTQSINAANDLDLSRALLMSYGVSVLAGLLFAWMVGRKARLDHLRPMGMLLFAVTVVILMRPEAPIIHFSLFPPWLPAIVSLCAVAMTVRIQASAGKDVDGEEGTVATPRR